VVVIAQSENAESVEWQDEDDLDITGIPQAVNVTGLPVCSTTGHFSSPWHDD